MSCLYTNLLGTTLSQLSDSGLTLSEDSGVDIPDTGGHCKNGSPRPSKSQSHNEQSVGQKPSPGAIRQVKAFFSLF